MNPLAASHGLLCAIVRYGPWSDAALVSAETLERRRQRLLALADDLRAVVPSPCVALVSAETLRRLRQRRQLLSLSEDLRAVVTDGGDSCDADDAGDGSACDIGDVGDVGDVGDEVRVECSGRDDVRDGAKESVFSDPMAETDPGGTARVDSEFVAYNEAVKWLGRGVVFERIGEPDSMQLSVIITKREWTRTRTGETAGQGVIVTKEELAGVQARTRTDEMEPELRGVGSVTVEGAVENRKATQGEGATVEGIEGNNVTKKVAGCPTEAAVGQVDRGCPDVTVAKAGEFGRAAGRPIEAAGSGRQVERVGVYDTLSAIAKAVVIRSEYMIEKGDRGYQDVTVAEAAGGNIRAAGGDRTAAGCEVDTKPDHRMGRMLNAVIKAVVIKSEYERVELSNVMQRESHKGGVVSMIRQAVFIKSEYTNESKVCWRDIESMVADSQSAQSTARNVRSGQHTSSVTRDQGRDDASLEAPQRSAEVRVDAGEKSASEDVDASCGRDGRDGLCGGCSQGSVARVQHLHHMALLPPSQLQQKQQQQQQQWLEEGEQNRSTQKWQGLKALAGSIGSADATSRELASADGTSFPVAMFPRALPQMTRNDIWEAFEGNGRQESSQVAATVMGEAGIEENTAEQTKGMEECSATCAMVSGLQGQGWSLFPSDTGQEEQEMLQGLIRRMAIKEGGMLEEIVICTLWDDREEYIPQIGDLVWDDFVDRLIEPTEECFQFCYCPGAISSVQ
ncbi:hypothetical protein CLOM_g23397 [Closterium sp. NIES-68]|nr:hypothetical protein CLOM_g23397 [Closterium sp. NIES-68]